MLQFHKSVLRLPFLAHIPIRENGRLGISPNTRICEIGIVVTDPTEHWVSHRRWCMKSLKNCWKSSNEISIAKYYSIPIVIPLVDYLEKSLGDEFRFYVFNKVKREILPIVLFELLDYNFV